MSLEPIPVTREIITWARKRADYSIEDAAEIFKKIGEWEEGVSYPSYPQIEKMSEKFKVPIAVFFFPEPPSLPPINESFRTFTNTEFDAIPRRIKFLLRKAKAFQLNLNELSSFGNPAERLITHDLTFTDKISIETMAEVIRDYIGISLDEQAAWPNEEEALKNWRQAFLKVGIFIFKDAFKVDDYSGFCLYDDTFPIIYVNNSSAKTRQIFTLFHELAHLLFHTSGVDTLQDEFIPALEHDAQRIEILCNKFAAAFLVPDTAFAAAFAGRDPTEDTAAEIAVQFHVSREFIYRKFLDRGLISQNDYSAAARRWASQRQSGSGGDHYWSKIAYLGRDYIALAYSEYNKNRISDAQLAEYLDTKPKNLSSLEEYFLRGVT